MATCDSRSLNSTTTLSGGHTTVMINYSLHLRVKVPTKVDQKSSKKSSEVINICRSEEEFADSPEEGEI